MIVRQMANTDGGDWGGFGRHGRIRHRHGMKRVRVALAGNANVGKSLSGDEYVFVNSDSEWRIVKIRDLANHAFESCPTVRRGQQCVANPGDLFVISLNLRTLKPEKKRVKYVLRHREARKLLHLKTSSGRTMSATKDHNFIALREGKPTVISGEEISVGDQLPVIEKLHVEQSRPVLDLGEYVMTKVRADNRQYQVLGKFVIVHGNRIPRLLRIDRGWARFLGIYLAEGSMTESASVPRISTSSEDIRDFLVNHLRAHHIPHSVARSASKNSYDVSVSKALSPILEEFGKNAGQKQIPSFVYEWNKELVRSLLNGYLQGDGWDQVTATHAITRSVKLQLGLIVLFAMIDRPARMSIRRVDGTPYYGVRFIRKPSSKRPQWLERLKDMGNLLSEARTESGLTQLEVSRELGWKAVKGNYVSALETERHHTNKKFLRRLVGIYKRRARRQHSAIGSLESLAYGDVVWDEVVKIDDEDPGDGHVYDLAVEDNENFMLANGVFVHNSVIFNHLTGLHQHVGNWPGKTVEKAEGTLQFGGYLIDVIDLPGIYSLSTFSLEETIATNHILNEKPDVVVNVVDASNLERNLYFTIQLLETETPMVIALNQVDMATDRGVSLDNSKLEEMLGIPVVPMVATRGVGFEELMRKVIDIFERRIRVKGAVLTYGDEVEGRVLRLANILSERRISIPARYAAIKLLEGDENVKQLVGTIDHDLAPVAEDVSRELEAMHGHPVETIVPSERYTIACRVAKASQRLFDVGPRLEGKLDELTTTGLSGYLIMIGVFVSMFVGVFATGDLLSSFAVEFLIGFEEAVKSLVGPGLLGELVWAGAEGVIAGVTLAIPYIVPFYALLGVLEDSGYLARMAFMMDSAMHLIGLHGKAFIPLFLGYGCNVPACLGCRIMETERDRVITAFLTTIVPCAARTIIILGLVGHFVGIEWALAIYALDVAFIFLLGRLAQRALPGEPTGLIIEVPPYRVPHIGTVVHRTWFQTSSFVLVAFPLMIAGSIMLKALEVCGLLRPIAQLLSPVTVGWLGLPSMAGVVLIFGVLRKELTLTMLSAVSGTTDLASILTPNQMIVFAVVTMFYIPCVATIAVLGKELGWRRALLIAALEIALAVLLGGIFARLLM